MPAAISIDLRIRILKDCDAGIKHAEVARKYSVSVPFIKKLKSQRAQSGTIGPKPHGGGRPRKLASREEDIRQIVESGQALSAAAVQEKLGVRCSTKTVWLELRRLGYRFKKRP